jgi:ferredoxin
VRALVLRAVDTLHHDFEEARMRIVVNFDVCDSNALCVDAAPEVFEVREDDLLYVLDETPGEELRATVERAAGVCPKQAITIIE